MFIMKIAGYNSFDFHYEMIGFLADFCFKYSHDLTVFVSFIISENSQVPKNDNGYIALYTTQFPKIVFKNISEFVSSNFDKIVLLTDDDPNFPTTTTSPEKVLCIDHWHLIRRPQYIHRVSTRPFLPFRTWAVSCWELKQTNKQSSFTTLQHPTIAIIGGGDWRVNTAIINRIRPTPLIVFISRKASPQKLVGLSPTIPVQIMQNLSAKEMFHVVSQCDYVATDVILNDQYTHKMMSGAIPLAWTCLTPLIISRETNKYYQFKNVIEFDETEDILLHTINAESLKQEKNELIIKRDAVLGEFCGLLTSV